MFEDFVFSSGMEKFATQVTILVRVDSQEGPVTLHRSYGKEAKSLELEWERVNRMECIARMLLEDIDLLVI